MTLKRSVQMILTVGALCAGGLTASARDMTAAERAGMEAAVADFTDAIAAGDHARVISYMPEKVLEMMAAKMDASVPDLRVALIKVTAEVMSKMTLESASFDVAAAREEEQIGGEPYAVIALETIMRAPDDTRILSLSQNVAFMNEAGEWRLMRIAGPAQRDVVAEAYPGFADLEVEPAVIKQLLP